jgi:elongator complex protein 3
MEDENPTKESLNKLKFAIAKKYKLNKIPSNSELIQILNESEKKILLPILRRKPTRALSGVNIVAVMTKPYPCPHGRCAYCPGGPEENSPQSYTGYEPAAMRGIQNQYDPFRQVESRIKQMQAIGHTVDKIELIIMGGTFPTTPEEYKRFFVKESLNAISNTKSKTLKEAKKNAEKIGIKNVGITVETRPDCLSQEQISDMLNLGVTRVEVGVQNIYDDIYNLVERGHTVQDVIKGTKQIKDSGLKICYHMMPGMPGSNYLRDLEGFKRIFTNPSFKPDMLKIYPTLVIKGTKIYDWWEKGQYSPYTTDEAVKLVSEIKSIIPSWIRIMRVQRDIPSHKIVAGVNKSNLRQLAKKRLLEYGKKCSCIRCREVGHRLRNGIKLEPDNLEILNQKYLSSEGIENFISVEDPENKVLIGFIRLRIPSKNIIQPEITSSSGLIRELHVYGKMTPVGLKGTSWQHKGWGETLLAEAERIAKEEYDIKKMIITSALGTKKYYFHLGYSNDGRYVSKTLVNIAS